jgi:predicted porin
VNSGEGVPGPTPNFNLEAYIGIRKAEIGTISFGQQYNLMADFLFYPPGRFDASFLYGGLDNMRQG